MIPKLTINHYDAIIFDLGGVLLNIDYQLSKKAFEELGIANFDLHFSQLSQSHLFDKFEKGEIDASDFRVAIKEEAKLNCNDHEIDRAWNAMLLNFPIHRIQFLEKIAQQVPIFLFSNTNSIHIHEFSQRMRELKIYSRFMNSFQKVYYSFELGHRKPDPEGFHYILKENELKVEKTLFIDDSEQHVMGAKNVGLQSILLKPNLEVSELFYHG